VQAKILQYAISILIGFLTPEMLRTFGDAILDLIENTVQKSESKVDDTVVLPLCALIRGAFGISDNDVAPPVA
jgi:hypothetical protein